MSNEMAEAIKVIKEMTAMMEPEEDYLTIVEAEEKIKASRAKKEKEIEEAHANLKALSKILEAAKQSATRPTSVPSAEAHSAAINEFSATELSLAKSISDAESNLASLETELATLKDESQGLMRYDPATEHKKELDGAILRLKIFRGMGFEFASDAKNSPSKVLIRSQSGDVHSLPLSNGNSRAEYTRQLWKLVAS